MVATDKNPDVRLPRWVTRNDIEAAGIRRTGGFWHVPGELLVHVDDVDAVREDLADLRVQTELDRSNQEYGLRYVRVTYRSDDRRVPAVTKLLSRLRSDTRRDAPRISPNHVYIGEPLYAGGPGDIVEAADKLTVVPESYGSGVVVGVLDTGLQSQHGWLQAFAHPPQATAGSVDVADFEGDGLLDAQAGHGTFIAGIVLQEAPGAQVIVSQVLSSKGLGTEDVIVREIVEMSREVNILNLSFGGYTEDDLIPPPLADALAQVDPDVVVIAAAGNDGRTQPFFPAASKRVIAVGALDDDGEPARFTNRGFWVDACAPGVRQHSAFLDFRGQLEADPGASVAFDGFATWSGTSFAAPRVAGKLAALMGKGVRGRAAVHQLLGGPDQKRLPDLGVILS